MILSIPELFKRLRELKTENFDRILNSESVPQISIIVPAYNEEANIVFMVDSLLYLSYRYKEIVIVNDGSSDSTLQRLKEQFHLVPVPPAVPPKIKSKFVRNLYRSKDYANLIVVDKERGGKVDADNAGLNAATSDYYITVDADTIISDQALQALIRPFMMNAKTIGCGGTIGIANDCELEGHRVKKINFPKNILAGIQVIEYLRSFIMGKLGWKKLGGHLIVSGAFGLFEKQRVLDAGGYKLEVGDDVEMTVRLNKFMLRNKKPYSIDFIPDLVSITEVPFTWKSLIKQRERWQRGVIEVMWRNKGMLFNPTYKMVGLIGIPYFIFIELISPFVEIFGYTVVVLSIYVGLLNWYGAMWLFILALGFPIVMSCICIFLESIGIQRYFSMKNFFKMIVCSFLEQFGYRQVLVGVRFWSFFRWLKFKIKKQEQIFTSPKRKGFKAKG
jgi:cellulose synthase/poly-beta-1,6-N-acetylglucosamine synthase-like glycosyltransferase